MTLSTEQKTSIDQLFLSEPNVEQTTFLSKDMETVSSEVYVCGFFEEVHFKFTVFLAFRWFFGRLSALKDLFTKQLH